MQCSALFLDRDGVINVDRGYIYRSAQFEFVPGIFELARFWTNELCRPIVVITNQSGIGRGYFDERDGCVNALKRNTRRSLASITALITPSMASASTAAIIRGASPTRV